MSPLTGLGINLQNFQEFAEFLSTKKNYRFCDIVPKNIYGIWELRTTPVGLAVAGALGETLPINRSI